MRLGKISLIMRIVVLVCMLLIGLGLIFAQGQEEGPIKVGVVAPLTGSFADEGSEFVRGAKMAVDELNAKGGLLGRPLKLVTGDVGGFSGEKIVTIGERLVTRDKVDFLLTQYLGGVVDIKSYCKYDVPYLHKDTSYKAANYVEEHIDQCWNVFQTCPPETAYGKIAYDFSTRTFPSETGYKFTNKKLAMVTMRRAYNKNIAKGFRAMVKKSDEWELVVDEVAPTGTVEWGPTLAKIRAAKPAAIFFNDHVPSDEVTFLEQFLRNPTKSLVFMQYGPSNPEFLKLAGEKANGIFWSTVSAAMGEKGAEFRENYRQKFGEEAGFGSAAGTYESFMMWAQAVERAGTVSDYREVARNLREFPFRIIGPQLIVFDPDNQTVILGEGLEPAQIFQVQNGAHELVEPSMYATAEIKVPSWMQK